MFIVGRGERLLHYWSTRKHLLQSEQPVAVKVGVGESHLEVGHLVRVRVRVGLGLGLGSGPGPRARVRARVRASGED